MQKVTVFSNKLIDSKIETETRADYFKAFVVFVNKLMKAPEIRTDMTLNSDLSFALDEVKQLKGRNQKEIKREKTLRKLLLFINQTNTRSLKRTLIAWRRMRQTSFQMLVNVDQ